ncbi:MAG: phosphatidylglycerophosphatase A [Balneolaceae bacterium]|nr:MAG: phosphatidylglycerophosphatase A [Balneolaceae bacterium]
MLTKIKLLTGALFGAGLSPKAPGTVGSLLTLPVIYITVLLFPLYGILILLLLTVILSLWSAPAAVEKFGEDPPQFVMDESAGQTLTFVAAFAAHHLSASFTLLTVGFILFRLFDILKPLGINRLQNLHGPAGILADDLLAGVYALICLEILIRFTPLLS